MIKIICILLLLVSCQNKSKQGKSLKKSLISEEFREYQYIKDVWIFDKKNNTSEKMSQFLSEQDTFKLNFLNEITKSIPDPKHVYYWEDKDYKFAIKLVVPIGSDIESIKVRVDYLLPSKIKLSETDMKKMSVRFNMYYELSQREKITVKLDDLYLIMLGKVSTFIKKNKFKKESLLRAISSEINSSDD